MRPFASFWCRGEIINFASAPLGELGFAKPAVIEEILAAVPVPCEYYDPFNMFYRDMHNPFSTLDPGKPSTWVWIAMKPQLILGYSPEISRIEWDPYGKRRVRSFWTPPWFEFGPECEFVFRLPQNSL